VQDEARYADWKEGLVKIVIIGAGPAGVTVAETVRNRDPQVELVVLSAEPYPPYSPPAMVDHFLTGSTMHYWRGKDWPERLKVDYQSGTRVVRVDPKNHLVETSEGDALSYDKLVIAAGSQLYAPLEGIELPGVCNFKSLSAAEKLVSDVRSGGVKSALIVGAGFIGVEIALLLNALGVKVTLIEMLDQIMTAILDKQTGAVILKELESRGIEVRSNTKATAFIGQDHASGVELESGSTLQADILIAATGVRPNVDFLHESGIEFEWGIKVDEFLRTNIKDIYAAGDVVEAHDRLTGQPYVHAIFPNAVAQGTIVGLNLLDYEMVYEGADRMNSLKHLGLPIMAAGLKEGDEVLRTKRNGNLRTLYIKEHRLVGFQLVGDIGAAGVFRALMIRGQDLRTMKDKLLESTFGHGTVAWEAISGLL
jgi:nitrite reductase (NADH) large subunit